MDDYQPATIQFTQSPGDCPPDSLSDQLLFVLLPQTPTRDLWQMLPTGDMLQTRFQSYLRQTSPSNKDAPTKPTPAPQTPSVFHTLLPNPEGTPVYLIYNLQASDAYERLTALRQLITQACPLKPQQCRVLAPDWRTVEQQKVVAEFLSCIAGYYADLPKITRKHDPLPNTNIRIEAYGLQSTLNITPIEAEMQANAWVRYLCNLPANHLTPQQYRTRIEALAKTQGWEYEFLDTAILTQKGAGAFLAVIQGSAQPDGGIVRVRYKPRNATQPSTPKLALVGKGLCFDTGGYNLKTYAGGMYGMKHDMTGSAVVLGCLMACTALQVPFEIEGWLALAQNDIGPLAYKPGDVVFASNGMSIEVINTDAEGRMVLADTLHLASLEKPDLIIDYATLTGSCVRALDNLYSGFITNRPRYNTQLTAIGFDCGERVWPFPYTSDYDEVLKSDIADIKQCHEGSADHIRAARFLGKFIANDTPWIHIDLSAHERKEGLAHIGTSTTGFGIRLTLKALLEHPDFFLNPTP
jgi:leucyl aminopeptidase